MDNTQTSLPRSRLAEPVAYYGTIAILHEHAVRLQRRGVEVGDYDYTHGYFHVRVSPESNVLLEELGSDVLVDINPRHLPDECLSPDIQKMTTHDLKAERAFNIYWIHSDRNDGRLSQVAAIDKRLDQLGMGRNKPRFTDGTFHVQDNTDTPYGQLRVDSDTDGAVAIIREGEEHATPSVEAYADAHLFAASKELLKAAQKALLALDMASPESERAAALHSAAREACIAAIAKALPAPTDLQAAHQRKRAFYSSHESDLHAPSP